MDSMILSEKSKLKVINLKDCVRSKANAYIEECFLGWAAEEGWNPGVYDMQLYLEVYPEAFYVLEVLSDEEKCKYEQAAIIFAPHDCKTNQASVGAYISEKTKYRGQGLGYKLWKHVFEQLDKQDKNSVRYLYGVPQQVSNYEKSGFYTTHDIIHYNLKAGQKFGPFRNIVEEYGSKKASKKLVSEYLKSNYSEGFAKFVAYLAKKQDVHIRVSLSPKTGKIIGVGMCRPLHDKTSYRYSIITNKGRIDAADDLFRSLNRNLTEKNEVVIDVRDETPAQKRYEAYAESEKKTFNVNSSFFLPKKKKSSRHGKHWTTEMNTAHKAQKELLETHAEPSLETNFLKKLSYK